MAEKILATGGGLTITDREVDELIAGLGQRGAAYNTPEGRRAVLNQLIGNKLLLLDARRNLYEGEPAFRDELNKLKSKFKAGDEVTLTVYRSEEETFDITFKLDLMS